jgi:DNA-directed RNA polymerase subunit RPC12/RpoP
MSTPLLTEAMARAQELCLQAHALCSTSRETRASIAHARRRSPYRRVHWLSGGASDDGIETRNRACPHCRSDRIQWKGRVMAEKGMVRISYRCESCEKPFLYVRATRDLFDWSRTRTP